ncbi:MAG: hypothetical protein SGBAC_012164 [Bacillariaceae sp.]
MHKELSKMSSQTMTSSSSSSSSSGGSDDENDDSIWNFQHGSRLEVFEQGQEVGYHNTSNSNSNNKSNKRGCCCGLSDKPLKYKFAVAMLAMAILACAVVVALTSMDISNSSNDLDTASSQNANVGGDRQDTNYQNKNFDDNAAPTVPPTRTPFPLATPDPTPGLTSPPPTEAPTEDDTSATYIPGKLTVKSNGLLLSEGLQSRIVATAGQPVTLTGLPPLQTTNSNGGSSSSAAAAPQYYKSFQDFHQKPDGAAIFDWAETGGWVYVSNSEVKESGQGGVGAIYFDKDGNVVDYQMLLEDTTMNCSGGPTPWGTWVSCEEIDGGKAYQVDPFGIRPPQELSTLDTGFFEAFAHDIRDPQNPAFYVTEDKERGPLRRIVPTSPDWEDPWEILHGLGSLEYLVLQPDPEDELNASGTYYWTTDRETAKINSQQYYKHSEGIDVHNNILYFVSKTQKELFILNLDDMTYEVHTTVSGVFDGHPDQMKRLIHNGLLYFCEEGGKENGVHARDENGWFFTIFESESISDETTGLAFSPDGMHMYVSYQHNGLIFDVWREDGLPFHGRTLNVKYHEIHQ